MTSRMLKLIALLLVVTVDLWAADPWVGTWKLNAEKSRFNPGPAPKSRTMIFEQIADQMKATIEDISADGTKTSTTSTGKYDGEPFPAGGEGNYTFAVKTVKPNIREMTFMQNGKPLYTGRSVLSKDGKTMTATTEGTNSEGKPFHHVVVYEKQ